MPPTKMDILTKVPGDWDDAFNHATRLAMETNREVTPAHVFVQGARVMVSAVMPVSRIIRSLTYNNAEKGTAASAALSATNRPQIPDHWKAIAAYLRRAIERGENFIIPPLTLNSTEEVDVIVPEHFAGSSSGYMVCPHESALFITDGQHRFLAIEQVAKDLRGTQDGSDFMQTCVPVMMTIENDTSQVHQDFADAGKTRALPPSLLAVWDTRQPANSAVMAISERVPLLKGRVDATSTTVSRSSPHIFLVNQIRQFVKHSLTGNTGIKEQKFHEEADNALGNRESRERWVDSRIAFLTVMSEIIPDWNEIAQLSPPYGPDSDSVVQKTKDIKQRQHVPMNGAFLTALGLVSHELLKDATTTDQGVEAWTDDLRERLKPFHQIDWSRGAAIWDTNIVIGGDKIRTQAPAVKGAADKMLALLKDEAQPYAA